jgi:hypothetical protein
MLETVPLYFLCHLFDIAERVLGWRKIVLQGRNLYNLQRQLGGVTPQKINKAPTGRNNNRTIPPRWS